MIKVMLIGTAHPHSLTESMLNTYAHTSVLNVEPQTLSASQQLTQLEDSTLSTSDKVNHVSIE